MLKRKRAKRKSVKDAMKETDARLLKKKEDEEREHRKGMYMVTTPRSAIVTNQKQLPIYWRKSMAKAIADKINGKVVKVELTW